MRTLLSTWPSTLLHTQSLRCQVLASPHVQAATSGALLARPEPTFRAHYSCTSSGPSLILSPLMLALSCSDSALLVSKVDHTHPRLTLHISRSLAVCAAATYLADS